MALALLVGGSVRVTHCLRLWCFARAVGDVGEVIVSRFGWFVASNPRAKRRGGSGNLATVFLGFGV